MLDPIGVLLLSVGWAQDTGLLDPEETARLDETAREGDAVIFMGAGSITVQAANYAGKSWGIEIMPMAVKVGN